MKPSQKDILMYGGCGIGIGVLVTFGLVFFLAPERLSKYSEPGSTYICLEDPKFDESIKIPNTTVSVGYPKLGLFGMGTDIQIAHEIADAGIQGLPDSKAEWLGGVNIATTESHIITPPSENNPRGEAFYGLGLSVSVFKKPINETLEQYIEKIKTDTRLPDTIERQYLKQGIYQRAEGKSGSLPYFTYRISEDAEAWNAVVYGEKEIVFIRLMASPNASKEYIMARGYAPVVLEEIVSNLSFE